MDNKTFLERTLTRLAERKIDVPTAVDRVLNEMGRGGRILVVDENLEGLKSTLLRKNYTVKTLKKGLKDEAIKPLLDGYVFITRNGKDFSKRRDMERYNYGLIWIETASDYNLAKKIAAAIRQVNFFADLIQVADVR